MVEWNELSSDWIFPSECVDEVVHMYIANPSARFEPVVESYSIFSNNSRKNSCIFIVHFLSKLHGIDRP
jgi:hypothetical protein